MNENAIKAIELAVHEKHSISNLEQLGVSQRLINLLQANGIINMSDLMYRKKEQLLSIANFGPKQLKILFSALERYDCIEN
jgi:DNA-directed RNA polymerase alpha subunit